MRISISSQRSSWQPQWGRSCRSRSWPQAMSWTRHWWRTTSLLTCPLRSAGMFLSNRTRSSTSNWPVLWNQWLCNRSSATTPKLESIAHKWAQIENIALPIQWLDQDSNGVSQTVRCLYHKIERYASSWTSRSMAGAPSCNTFASPWPKQTMDLEKGAAAISSSQQQGIAEAGLAFGNSLA